MKKTAKKLLLSVFVVLIVFTCALLCGRNGVDAKLVDVSITTTASAATQGYYTYEVSGDEAIITAVDVSISGKVTIPSKLGGYIVTIIDDCAFSACESLTSITIPDSVTSIGYRAFSGCLSLSSITIPASVKNIGHLAFAMCTNLTSIKVNKGSVYYSSDSYGVLFNKNKTELIQYPCANERKSYSIPGSVKIIADEAFAYCRSIVSVTIPDSVTSIGDSAFRICENLTSVTLSDSLDSIGDSAFYATGLTSITLPSSLTKIGYYAFEMCKKLTNITIPDSVTSIGSCAFYNCQNIKSIKIPDSVTSIGTSAFFNTAYYNNDANWSNGVLYIGKHLIKATSDKISGTYTIKKGTKVIADGAFASCTGLTSITIPAPITNIGLETFSGCTKLKSITISDSVKSIGYSAFSGCTSLKSIKIPDSVTSIGSAAFAGCTSLTSIKIPDSVTSISASLLSECNNLKSVTLGNSVTNIGEDAFSYCKNLKSITIPSSVISIGRQAFYYCESLANIKLPDSLTSIGSSVLDNTAFYNDDANWNNGVLYNGKHLIEAAPDKISGTYDIKNGTKTLADLAFYSCEKLTSITIPDSVENIGTGAFSYCTGLKSITIPDTVKSISTGTFGHCTRLKSITIPDSVTSIDYAAFEYCTGLTSIIIHDSVTSIGFFVFAGCASIENVYYTGTKTQWGNIDIDECNEYLTNATIHYNCFIQESEKIKTSSIAKNSVFVLPGQTVATLRKAMAGNVKISDNNSKVVADTAKLATGMQAVLSDSNGNALYKVTVVVPGDVDGDGAVKAADARRALRAAVSLETLSEYEKTAADLDTASTNHTVNSADARYILRMSVGLETADVWLKSLK